MMDDLARRLAEPAYWLHLSPGLHVDGSALCTLDDAVPFSTGELEKHRADVATVGYYTSSPVLPLSELHTVLEVVGRLHAMALPPVFAFVYDETWNVFLRLGRLWSALLGEDWRFIPSLWGWFVDVGGEHAGWRAHRDRPSVTTVAEDGSPLALTAWVPLTPSLTSNGCMYVLPAPRTMLHVDAYGLQYIRALPAQPGMVIGWRHDVVHWGSRSTSDARFPRVSLSVELQRGDVAPFQELVIDPLAIPAFDIRIRLAAAQILNYRHMAGAFANLETLARTLYRG